MKSLPVSILVLVLGLLYIYEVTQVDTLRTELAAAQASETAETGGCSIVAHNAISDVTDANEREASCVQYLGQCVMLLRKADKFR